MAGQWRLIGCLSILRCKEQGSHPSCLPVITFQPRGSEKGEAQLGTPKAWRCDPPKSLASEREPEGRGARGGGRRRGCSAGERGGAFLAPLRGGRARRPPGPALAEPDLPAGMPRYLRAANLTGWGWGVFLKLEAAGMRWGSPGVPECGAGRWVSHRDPGEVGIAAGAGRLGGRGDAASPHGACQEFAFFE